MELLDNENVDLTNAVLVSSAACEPAKLWRFDLDCYAVTAPDQPHPAIAFRSVEFSILLVTAVTEVNRIEVLKAVDMAKYKLFHIVEIRISSGDGECFSLNNDGEVRHIMDMFLTKVEDREAIQLSDIWDVPDEAPYDRLLLSHSYIDWVKPYVEQSSAVEVISRLWRDFERQYVVPLLRGAMTIHSEFGAFCVTELPCGRYVMMTEEEVKDRSIDPG